jgi:flagellin-like protein
MDGARANRARLSGTRRSVSPVIGVVLLVAVVIALAVVMGTFVIGVSDDGLDSAVVHTQVHYEMKTGPENEQLRIQSNAASERETDLVLSINGKEITTWDGHGKITIECLYPNDHVTLTSENEDATSTVLLEEFYFTEATKCPQYNTFPEKFRHAIVDGDEYVINDRYAFGLSIDPNGRRVAYDETGDEGQQLGKISLSNEWHHVQLYTNRSIEGFEPPVFVIVLVDNVHWAEAPDPSHHSEIDDTYYNWTTEPPDIPLGSNAYSLDGPRLDPQSKDNETEPTNDVFMVFKPGCEESNLRLITQTAGYHNQIYLGDESIVDDASEPDNWNETFEAPGVDCPGGIEWE